MLGRVVTLVKLMGRASARIYNLLVYLAFGRVALNKTFMFIVFFTFGRVVALVNMLPGMRTW